jgi:hypothetical protein
MDMHYCDIFSECFHCPVPFCPYEKLDSWGHDDGTEDEEEYVEEEEEDDGW